RLHAGKFYALPQSPQQYKQLLMVGGVERYFQIARCFRDEDLRADRQPEFTQLDVEMSFVDQEDILRLTEDLAIALAQAHGGRRIASIPFPRLTYAEAMERYGSDKPDLRFGLLLTDVTDAVRDSEFRVFTSVVASGGQVKGIRVPGGASYTRRETDELTRFVTQRGAKGLVPLAITAEGLRSPLTKSLPREKLDQMIDRLAGQVGDLLMFVADQPDVVATALGELRLEVGRRLGLLDPGVLAFAWVTEMPAFEWNAERGRYQAKHHQFTAPLDQDIPCLDSDPLSVRAKQYDLVGNGYELAGGSIRIHRRELQARIFQLIGIDDQDAAEMFGHLLEAFEYGTPPHGGIAWGLDRWVMLFAGESVIRDVIAFPKTQSGVEPMTGTPSSIRSDELRDLHIAVTEMEAERALDAT
ncbi:MAG: aspartate--tRNA ligase, partial [Chloroflexi bacterium]|nr:aspartate--tRNA ligase [Chloroflexota bacterium]